MSTVTNHQCVVRLIRLKLKFVSKFSSTPSLGNLIPGEVHNITQYAYKLHYGGCIQE
jgi:hypothetical protein